MFHHQNGLHNNVMQTKSGVKHTKLKKEEKKNKKWEWKSEIVLVHAMYLRLWPCELQYYRHRRMLYKMLKQQQNRQDCLNTFLATFRFVTFLFCFSSSSSSIVAVSRKNLFLLHLESMSVTFLPPFVNMTMCSACEWTYILFRMAAYYPYT